MVKRTRKKNILTLHVSRLLSRARLILYGAIKKHKRRLTPAPANALSLPISPRKKHIPIYRESFCSEGEVSCFDYSN